MSVRPEVSKGSLRPWRGFYTSAGMGSSCVPTGNPWTVRSPYFRIFLNRAEYISASIGSTFAGTL
jgi:hypothetical protein